MTTEKGKLGAFLCRQYQGAITMLEGTVADVTPEQAHWLPPGKAMPLDAQYAHIVTSQDAVINGMIRHQAPLAATTWAGKTGLSEAPPQGFAWSDWARNVQIDLPSLRHFAQAVYAHTYDYPNSLSDEDLDSPLDMSSAGAGMQTVGWMLSVMLDEISRHCGEVSCVKGLQGAKGYPM